MDDIDLKYIITIGLVVIGALIASVTLIVSIVTSGTLFYSTKEQKKIRTELDNLKNKLEIIDKNRVIISLMIRKLQEAHVYLYDLSFLNSLEWTFPILQQDSIKPSKFPKIDRLNQRIKRRKDNSNLIAKVTQELHLIGGDSTNMQSSLNNLVHGLGDRETILLIDEISKIHDTKTRNYLYKARNEMLDRIIKNYN